MQRWRLNPDPNAFIFINVSGHCETPMGEYQREGTGSFLFFSCLGAVKRALFFLRYHHDEQGQMSLMIANVAGTYLKWSPKQNKKIRWGLKRNFFFSFCVFGFLSWFFLVLMERRFGRVSTVKLILNIWGGMVQPKNISFGPFRPISSFTFPSREFGSIIFFISFSFFDVFACFFLF